MTAKELTARELTTKKLTTKEKSTAQPARQLFGTDGIRGIAGEFPLTQESTCLIGFALGHDLVGRNPGARVVIGQDTRESSGWIADRIALGLASAGVTVDSAGVITTPGIAYLARSRKYDAGVVISASHNPWMDNGIKIFSGDGFKLPDAEELSLEREIFSLVRDPNPHSPTAQAPRTLPGDAGLRRAYIEWLVGSVKANLSGLRVLVDCANGAATAEAPEMFAACGIAASFLGDKPDGRNINRDCGALHPQRIATAVADGNGSFDLGITFDGDADRALFSDECGRIVNGDGILLLAARDFQARNGLPGSTIVATTMSNMGLEIALRASGIRLLRANVGDKYVLDEMLKTGAALGGEQSGHIIFRDGSATTGDGLLTALRVMEIMVRSQKKMSELVADLKILPQTIQNISVREKVPLEEIPEIQRAIQSAEQELNGNGRVVVRYSGTEPLARVMVEAESQERMMALAERIVAAIRDTLGVEVKA
ncbi:MAG: phosphoglucosamine mutase [Terriglobales bacterium]